VWPPGVGGEVIDCDGSHVPSDIEARAFTELVLELGGLGGDLAGGGGCCQPSVCLTEGDRAAIARVDGVHGEIDAAVHCWAFVAFALKLLG